MEILRTTKPLLVIAGILALLAIALIMFRRQGQPAGLAARSTTVSVVTVTSQPEAAPTRDTSTRATETQVEATTPTTQVDGESDAPEIAALTPTERAYNIVTLLPRDAIPAIDNPSFYSAEEADAEYDPDELVLGVSINGESKAYSSAHLDGHEIVNDTLGGRKIAVTW